MSRVTIIVLTTVISLLAVLAFAWPRPDSGRLLPSWPIDKARLLLKDVLEKSLRMVTTDGDRVMELMTSFWKSKTLAIFAELGIADILQTQSLTCSDISAAIERNTSKYVYRPFVCRMLDACSHLHLLTARDGVYSITSSGRLLAVEDGSLRAFALFMHSSTWVAWGNLTKAMHSGRSGFEEAFGEPVWEYMARHPEEGALFGQGLTGLTVALQGGPALAQDVPVWPSCRRICDIGGGRGHLLADILDEHLPKHPEMTGVVLELPEVVPSAIEYLASRGFPPSVATARAASYFKPVREDCDCVLMRYIMHAWNDTDVVRILRNVAEALPADGSGHVILVEYVLDPAGQGGSKGCFKSLMDMNMMAECPGRERSEVDFRSVFDEAGLRLLSRISMRTQTLEALIVVEKAVVVASPMVKEL